MVRIIRRQVDPSWHQLVGRGLVALCEPVIAEAMLVVDAKRYTAAEKEFRETYVVATIPDGMWDLTVAIRHELAPHSAHLGLAVTDLVVAATAIRLKLEVLHEDADFETMARFVPELRQRRIGTAPEL
ncbi:PIN domain-containing protein [Dactylosporangium sp. CA-233914]|uniref:PIN domain-containing protein n=1 Tax=Dactylosporangium sp. CA-233914 TaxID=3239934 RepID=UPI003D93FCDD